MDRPVAKTARRTAQWFGVAALLLSLAACGEDEPLIEPGGCIDVGANDNITAVKCDDPAAEYVLVQSMGPLGGECSSPERKLEVANIVDGRPLGPPSVWCVVQQDNLGPEQRERIEKAKGSEG